MVLFDVNVAAPHLSTEAPSIWVASGTKETKLRLSSSRLVVILIVIAKDLTGTWDPDKLVEFVQ